MTETALPPPGVDPEPGAALARLAGLRERGADRRDPVRFRFIEALARRSAGHAGEARRLLDQRLAELLAAYGEAGPAAETPPPTPAVPSALAALLGELARLSAEGDGREADATAMPGGARPTTAPPVELKALRYFRSRWARLSVEQQLSRSLAKVPENAGPLNSQLLALRALQRMRELSPDYLDRYMSYLDTLMWLDQASPGAAPGPAGGRAEGEKKRRPARTRTG